MNYNLWDNPVYVVAHLLQISVRKKVVKTPSPKKKYGICLLKKFKTLNFTDTILSHANWDAETLNRLFPYKRKGLLKISLDSMKILSTQRHSWPHKNLCKPLHLANLTEANLEERHTWHRNIVKQFMSRLNNQPYSISSLLYTLTDTSTGKR